MRPADGGGEAMTTSGQSVQDTIAGVPRNRPGFRRLGVGGFALSLVSALTAGSLLSALLGIGAVDFTVFGITVTNDPGTVVINGVALPVIVAMILAGSPVILGIIGGGRLWLGWAGPRWALVACVVWEALAVVLILAGATWWLLAFTTGLFAVVGSGAWADRRPGSDVFDLFRRAG